MFDAFVEKLTFALPSKKMTIGFASAFIYRCGTTITTSKFSNIFLDVEEIKDQLEDDIKFLKWSSTTPPTNDATYLNTILDRASPSAPNPPDKPGYNDQLLYIYTSGTTGLPKAAIITNVRYVYVRGEIDVIPFISLKQYTLKTLLLLGSLKSF